MAAALHPSRNDTGPNVHANLLPRALMADLDFRDNRYPTLSSPSPPLQRTNPMAFGASDPSGWESASHTNDGIPSRPAFDPSGPSSAISTTWAAERRDRVEPQYLSHQPSEVRISADLQSQQSQSQQSQSQSQEPQRSTLSYALPPGVARRVVERYSLDDTDQRTHSRASADTRPTAVESIQDRSRNTAPQAVGRNPPQGRPTSPATPRHPAGPSNSVAPNFSLVMPLSASPSYNPPIATKHRAYAQQPTYITPPATPTPINTVYSPRPPKPQEEICVECAMRDQDMADVDVTSPGVWERESDAAFEELKQRELEDDANGLVTIDDPRRPRVKGGRLSEQNLKMWLSVNPREPASRQQTLNTYLKSQRTLLEAEALARAHATKEAKQLDSRMRDTYSQLRRSAYDMGSSAAPADDTGGVRIRPPLSPSSPANHVHARSHSREITLLENGMIVEHVDVRKEEREARERRRKEERRARKSSRSSGMDVTSIISAQSFSIPQTDSGVGLKPYSRYSQASSARPISVLTAPLERPDLPRAYSQASFSDVHSLGSASPRRSRFFGIKNLGSGWRSQDSLAPSGMSGSMVDMHVALQREAYVQQPTHIPMDISTPRRSQIWSPAELEMVNGAHNIQPDEKPKKKKGFAKFWRVVTGSSKHDIAASREISQSYERNEDDLPLAPPPPLSYLVDRGPSDLRPVNGRGASTPSLPSTTSPKMALASPGMSPFTGPSSILPSPSSSPPSGPDLEMIDARKLSGDREDYHEQQHRDNNTANHQALATRNIHPVTSEPDIRVQAQSPPPLPTFVTPPSRPASVMSREKSLPPLPGEPGSRTPVTPMDPRPRTVYTYDARQLPPGFGPAHDFLPPNAPFRAPDVRRQSFGGMSSRPNLAVQTMPINSSQAVGFDPRISFGPRYDEFGFSQRSLGPLEHVKEHPSPSIRKSPVTSTKRKSRFGLSSLLGKKSTAHEQGIMNDSIGHQFPPMRQSGSDGQDDLTNNGYATSTSRHSALSTSGPNTRMSVASRRALEERVAQDRDFVAYRYPSNDQRLDLLR